MGCLEGGDLELLSKVTPFFRRRPLVFSPYSKNSFLAALWIAYRIWDPRYANLALFDTPSSATAL